ncbi:MAG: hypothetical protein KFH98_11350 [Gemmatimonadetes bacterium]|nr:hypothetical protein [Gemmatimonadota bacterium]
MLFGALLLGGCPYSGIPLGAPDPGAFEPRLIGEWVLVGDSATLQPGELWSACPDSIPTVMTFVRFNPAEYLMSMNGTGCEVEHTRAFPTRIGDVLFLNVQDEALSIDTDASTTFSLVRADLSGDTLVLRFVSEEIGTPQSPQDLRGMVQRRLEDSTVYEEEVYRFHRRAPSER